MSGLGPAAVVCLVAMSVPDASAGPGGPRLAATSSAAPSAEDPLLDPAPLSDEELALLAALDTATAAAPASPPEQSAWGPPPGFDAATVVDAPRLDETVARGVLEAFDAHPGLRGRWRWGPRGGLSLDGLVLDASLLRQLWGRAHPGLFGRVEAHRAPHPDDPVGALGGHLALSSGRARYGAGFTGQAATALRVADRGLEAQADLQYGGDRAAVRGFATLTGEGDLRRGADADPRPEAGARSTVGVDARATPWDGVELDARAALHTDAQAGLLADDALTGVVGRDLTAWLVGGGARLASSGDRHVARVRGGYTRAVGTFGDVREAAATGQVAAAGHVTVVGDAADRLRVLAGGRLVRSRTEAAAGLRRQARETGHLGLDGRWGRVRGRGVVRVTRVRADDSASELLLLPQASLQLGVFSGLSLAAHVVRRGGLDAPVASTPVVGPRGVRTAWVLRGGPRWRSDGLWLDLDVGAAWAELPDDPGEADVSVVLVEVDGGARLWGGLELAAAAGWAEGVDDADRVRLAWPRLRGHVALRYGFGAPQGFVELRVRGATGALVARGLEDPRFSEGLLRVGLAGGVDLGAGFALALTVENALDRALPEIDGPLGAPGVDVRGRLAWRW